MKNFDNDINNLKNKINNMHLSEEYKENLKNKLKEEYNKPIANIREDVNKLNVDRNFDEKKTNLKKFSHFTKKILATCAACVIITSCVFADEIENVVKNLFSNTYKEFEMADVDLKTVESEYITNEGVSIKLDAYTIENDNLYLVFNVLCEEEFDECYISDYVVKDENNEIVFDRNNFVTHKNIINKFEIKQINKNNRLIYVKLENCKDIKNKKRLNINIKEIVVKKKTIENKSESKKINTSFSIEV